MAAVERVLVAQGWHLPRWRTTNREYGKFHQPHIPAHPPKGPLHFAHPPPHHVIEYATCSNQCRPHHPQHHVASADTPSPSPFHDVATLGPPFVRSSAQRGVGLDAHIQHLTLQEDRPSTLHGAGQDECMRNQLADENRAASTLDDRPPWRPKPLKPMILFEKYGQASYQHPKKLKHKKNRWDVQ